MSNKAIKFPGGEEVSIRRLVIGKATDGKQGKIGTLEESLSMELI